MWVLHQALDAARSFRPLQAWEIEALLAKTAGCAKDGAYEFYKTTDSFDGTTQNPEWLG